METKRCSKCKRTRPLSEFYRDKRHADGNQSHCKECQRQRHRQYYQNNRSRLLQYKHAYILRYKRATLDRLGGARCALCGCEELIFLTVDHTDGNGHIHRKQIGNGSNTHRWILKASDVELKRWHLRVLCSSCQKATQHQSDDEVRAAMKREHSRIRRIKT